MSEPCTHPHPIIVAEAPNMRQWCDTCGAICRPRLNTRDIEWRLCEREKWNLAETPERDDALKAVQGDVAGTRRDVYDIKTALRDVADALLGLS